MRSLCLRYFVTALLLGVVSALAWAQQPVGNYTGSGTEKDPVISADGKDLFFSRSGDHSNQGRDNAADVWVRTRYPDGSWGRAINPGSPINSFAHDHPLAINADKTRLVVLRNGLTNYIDLLERKERNWRIVGTWTLPEGVYPRIDLTFDLNGQRLIYSAYGSNGTLDLYERQALPNGRWSSAQPLTLLNGAEHNTNPQMAADGRTLYFRSGGEWWIQTEKGRRARATFIAGGVEQFSVSNDPTQPAVIVFNDHRKANRLQAQMLPSGSLPPSARLVRGYLGVPLEPGANTAMVQLQGGKELQVYPDALKRYELFLRDGEEVVVTAADATVAGVTGTRPGSLASATEGRLESDHNRLRLQEGIAYREAALKRLDAERRRYDLAIPKETDPELEALRSRFQESQGMIDTLPPAGNSVKEKYARELRELELMKAKFRRQQEEKLRQRSGNGSHRWTEKSATPVRPQPAEQQVAIPSIAESYTPPGTTDPNAQRQQSRQDSIRLGAQVRSDLYPDRRPKVYEREPWENAVRNDLPRTEPITPEEAARLDAEYQQQQAELAALRLQLQRLNETTPATSAQQPTNWTAKGNTTPEVPAPVEQPATYGQPQAGVPMPYQAGGTPPAPGISAGISFIPNTAYPDGAGYTGLDQLVKQLAARTSPLEIRVHTPLELERRVAQLLSEERAKTIRDHLREQGVPEHLYKVIGFGNNLTGSGGERVEVR